jgi:Arylsulfotransferase (ASST)
MASYDLTKRTSLFRRGNPIGSSFNFRSVNNNSYISPPVSAPLYSTNLVNFQSTQPITTLSVSASNGNSIYPAFNTSTLDYAITACGPVESSIGYTLFVNGSSVSTSTITTKKALQVYDGTNTYYIRFLPNGLPVAPVAYGPTVNYNPGYYLVGGWFWEHAFGDQYVDQYYSIYNQHGVPIWFTPSLSAESVSLHLGNTSNRVITNGNVGLPRYVIDIGTTGLSATSYTAISSINSSPWAFHIGGTGWDIHESQILGGAYGDNGKILCLIYTLSGFNIQIQNPDHTIHWEWDSAPYLSAFSSTYDTNDFYHVNSVDVNPGSGDVLVSLRNCSAIMNIDRSTKNISWVLQGSNTLPNYCLSAAMLQSTLDSGVKFLTIQNEPNVDGFQYHGPICAHDARWKTDLTISKIGQSYGSDYISLYDDQSFFAPVSTAAPYWPATATKLFNCGLSARAVIYEIDVTNGIAYHHSSVFNPNNITVNFGSNPHCSPFTGSHTSIAESDGTVTTGVDFSRKTYVAGNPIYREYRGSADDSNRSQVFALDFPGANYYRIIKVPLTSLDINALRITAGMYLNE